MKCGAMVRWEDHPRGTGVVRRAVRYWDRSVFDSMLVSDLGFDDRTLAEVRQNKSQYKPCDGELRCEIETIDEPCWGGSYARTVISYSCSKCPCKHENDPRLPTGTDELAAFVTARLTDMPDSGEMSYAQLKAEVEHLNRRLNRYEFMADPDD